MPNPSEPVWGYQTGTFNGTTYVNMVDAPPSHIRRVVHCIFVHNADTSNQTFTIKHDDNGTAYVLFRANINTVTVDRVIGDNPGEQVVLTATDQKVMGKLGGSPFTQPTWAAYYRDYP